MYINNLQSIDINNLKPMITNPQGKNSSSAPPFYVAMCCSCLRHQSGSWQLDKLSQDRVIRGWLLWLRNSPHQGEKLEDWP